MPSDTTLWPSLTGGEVIDLLGRLGGGVDPKRRDELVERFELDPRKKPRTYSKGNRQKVALIAALASGAQLLILDEPTAGLDPLMESIFQRTIAEVKAEGRTVLLSSHIFAEVEALADRVSIIRAGRVVESGTLADLRHLTRTTVSVESERSLAGLDGFDGVHDLDLDGTVASFDVNSDALDPVMRFLSDRGIRALTCHPPTLEELFLRHYGDELQEEQAAAERT